MKKITRRSIEFSVLFGLICAVLLSFSRFNAVCDDLRGSVLRLHIIANSDSSEDQALKLLVRDRILEEGGDTFEGNMSLEQAIAAASKSLDGFTDAANEVIAENGFEYTAKAEIGDSYFETREYDDFTLPAGTYKSLTVRLGNADGKNWWCVIFPAVCVPAAARGELSDSASSKSAEVAEGSEHYVMRFKTVEIYEDIKKFLKK